MGDYEIREVRVLPQSIRPSDLLNILAKAMSYDMCYITDSDMFIFLKLAKLNELNEIRQSCVFHFKKNGKHKALKFKTYKEALQYLHNALLNNETISVISLTSKDFYASITPELAGEFLFECALHGDLLTDDN